MMRPRGMPPDLDAGASAQIERTFLVVRIVRGGLALAFIAVAAAAVEVKGWPHGVTIALTVALALQAGRLGVDLRRLARLAGAAERSSRTPR